MDNDRNNRPYIRINLYICILSDNRTIRDVMLLLDDNSLMTLAAGQQTVTPSSPDGSVLPVGHALDSLHHTVKDSLQQMDLAQIKEVVTGQNQLLHDALSALVSMAVGFVPKMIGACIVLWIGFKLIKLVKRALLRMLEKRGAELSLKTFLASLVDVLLKAMLIIMAMDIIGIKATSFIAILGAMGLAVGMAMQGTLQNFAGGVILLLMKPFKVDDYIECGNYKGYVKEIRIFHTLIRPFNGRIIVVPNSELATKSLVNHTRESIIRLDVVASVAYGTDLAKAREALQEVVDAEPLVQRDYKAPVIAVSELGESSVNLSVWLWVTVEDYWTVWLRIRENIYNKFYEKGIAIPFPQMDVHLKNEQ